MVLEEKSFSAPTATFTQRKLIVPIGKKLKGLIVETSAALDADSESKMMCLSYKSDDTIRNPIYGGVIFFDMYRLGGTDGFQKFRFEYDLKNRIQNGPKNELFFQYQQSSGGTDNVKIYLEYH